MEDIISILVVILIAVASVSSKNKKKKAKAPDSKGPVQFSPQGDKGFGEMKEFIRDVGKAVLEIEEDDVSSPAKIKGQKLQAKDIKAAAKPAKPAVSFANAGKASIIEEELGITRIHSSQGRSLFEDKGCISGSIAHDSHEGDSKYPFVASEGAGCYDEASVNAEDIAKELQAMNVQRLRRAIVVSEILDRPKALRRR